MKAAVVHNRSAPFTLEDLRDPEPGPGEILVRVAACGVCHTDLHVHDGSVAFPFPAVLRRRATGRRLGGRTRRGRGRAERRRGRGGAIGRPYTFRQATEMVGDGGRCVMIGIAPVGRTAEVEITRLVRRKIQIRGSFGGRPRQDLAHLARLVADGLLDRAH